MTPETTFFAPIVADRSPAARDYAIDFDTGRLSGVVCGDDALRQSIRLRLLTERGAYPIFSSGYGLPFRLFSQLNGDVFYIQIKNYITETLLADSRVRAVDSFAFSRPDGGAVHVGFRVQTQEDEFREETIL